MKKHDAVEVAKDVLQLLKMQKIEARSDGHYFAPTDWMVSIMENEGLSLGEVRDLENGPACTVCAKGACLYAMANGIHLGFTTYSDTEQRLPWCEAVNTFGQDTWDMMEMLFEGWDVPGRLSDNGPYPSVNLTLEKLSQFVEKYPEVEDRITYIMNNIIRNKGELVIPARGFRS